MALYRQQKALLALRLGVFVVMFIWTLDKFVRPEHASGIFQKFYLTPGFGAGVSYAIGFAQALAVAAFVLGFRKRVSYGVVFVLHGISTLSSYSQYLHPWDGANILFFAAWPMWAAIYALYVFRDQDVLFSLDARAGKRA